MKHLALCVIISCQIMSTVDSPSGDAPMLGTKRPLDDAGLDGTTAHAEKKQAFTPQPPIPGLAAPLRSNPDSFRFCTRLPPNISHQLRAEVVDILSKGGKVSAQSDNLPGPLPFSLGRGSLPLLLQNDYQLCEKSDGQRVMLYVTKERACLIDRKFVFYQINDPTNTYTTKLAGPSSTDVTLVDGELIENAGTYVSDNGKVRLGANNNPDNPQSWITEPLLVLFDTVMVKGDYKGEKTLMERLAGIAEVKGPIKYMIDNGMRLPLRIESKEFLQRQFLLKLHEKIKKINIKDDRGADMTYYVYKNDRKGVLSLNDGVILTPVNNNYMHKRNENLPIYKFKWPGLHTVDFLLAHPFFKQPNTNNSNPSSGGVDGPELMLFTDATNANDLMTRGGGGGKGGRPVRVLFKSVTIKPDEAKRLVCNILLSVSLLCVYYCS